MSSFRWLTSLVRRYVPQLFRSSLPHGIRQAMAQGQPGQWASDHSAESRRFTGWHYVAIHAKAKQAAAAVCEVFVAPGAMVGELRRSHDQEITAGTTPLPAGHRLVRLLRRPNPWQAGASLRYEIAQQLDLTGTALIAKVRNRAGLPVELYVVPTASARPLAACAEHPRGGWQIERSARSSGMESNGGYAALTGTVVEPADMLAIRWPHPLFKGDGQGAVSAGALWSDTAAQLDQSRWSHLRNGAVPSLLIAPGADYQPDPAEIDRVLSAIENRFAGPGNAGKSMVLPPGATVTPLQSSAQEMGYLEAFTQLRDATLALHGTPGVAAGITDGGSYAAFYAALQQFITLTVQPMLTLMAEELSEQLAVEFGEGLIVSLTAASVDDPELLERRLATDLAARAITKNELRALRGLEPHPQGEAWAGEAA